MPGNYIHINNENFKLGILYSVMIFRNPTTIMAIVCTELDELAFKANANANFCRSQTIYYIAH